MVNKLFTVVIISYQEPTLLRAVDSVLAQDYSCLELVIYDNHSCDFNAEDIEKYICTHRKENLLNFCIKKEEHHIGAGKILEKAAAITSGDYITFMLDTSFLACPDAISSIVKVIQTEQAEILVCREAKIGQDYKNIAEIPTESDFQKVKNLNSAELRRMLFSHPDNVWVASNAVYWQRSAFENVGGFDSSFAYEAAEELVLRASVSESQLHFCDMVTVKTSDFRSCDFQPEVQATITSRRYTEQARALEKNCPFLGRDMPNDYRLAVEKVKARSIYYKWGSMSNGEQWMYRLKGLPYWWHLMCSHQKSDSLVFSLKYWLITDMICLLLFHENVSLCPGLPWNKIYSAVFLGCSTWIMFILLVHLIARLVIKKEDEK